MTYSTSPIRIRCGPWDEWTAFSSSRSCRMRAYRQLSSVQSTQQPCKYARHLYPDAELEAKHNLMHSIYTRSWQSQSKGLSRFKRIIRSLNNSGQSEDMSNSTSPSVQMEIRRETLPSSFLQPFSWSPCPNPRIPSTSRQIVFLQFLFGSFLTSHPHFSST